MYPPGVNVLEKLRQLHTEIASSRDGLKVVDAWGLAERLIGRFPVDDAEVKRVFGDKDADGLDALITKLENPAPEAAPKDASASDEEMQAAMRAFRKRLKLARLADESKLGGRYTSGGRKSAIDAIQPPDGFPDRVWRALVGAGKLKDTGQGFYAEV